MKFLLTGGSGFIGSHLTDKLLKEGHEVVIVDRSVKWKNLIDSKNSKLHIYQENILSNIAYLFKDVDLVFHLGAITRPQWSIQHPFETNEVNVNGTLKLLEHVRDANVKRFVFLSTSAVYGEQSEYPTPESVRPNPMNPYAISKLIGEQYCKLFGDIYDLEWNAIRPFNAYGSRMPTSGIYTSAVATFINALKENKPFIKFGDGNQRRDFIYIDDLVEQIMLMSTSKIHGEVFNCGFGKNYSINEMLSLVRKIMGKSIVPDEIKKQYEPSQTLADISKAEELLNWKPKIDLEEGLRRTIENSN